jgi:hypothetical protein
LWKRKTAQISSVSHHIFLSFAIQKNKWYGADAFINIDAENYKVVATAIQFLI